MRILLDTHALHWAVDAPERLGVAGRALLGAAEHEVFVSPISGWELAQHARKGTIMFDRPVAAWVDEAVSGLEAVVLPITMAIALDSELLDYPHRDPGDRFLLATALAHDLVMLTRDERMQAWLGSRAVW